ncbi:MAG: hypothetical protein V4582_10260 [Pseudomonadota bacterium]
MSGPARQEPPAPARHPILFVTQVPLHTDVAARLSAFANHLTGIEQVPRGGDLMLLYPDGALRNLTREAGYGGAGAQGPQAIAVREPTVHWSGGKAIFSMLVGAPARQGQRVDARWQIYEASGLGRLDHARITRVARQPAAYNNVSPLYASDDSVLFTSDRPRDGQVHLYPQLDEYEATPTTTGIWRLDPASGALTLLNHAPSGAFSPTIDSFGRLLFVRWDHLQQDQLAQRDRDTAGNGVAQPFKSFNYADESAGAPALDTREELFPEPRSASASPYGPLNGLMSNFFTAWQMNQDGSGEETLNHVGQHELAFGPMATTFGADPALARHTNDALHANRVPLRREGGLFHLREDGRQSGSYLATAAREAGSFTTGQIIRLSGAPTLTAEQMTVSELTPGAPDDALPGGRFRNPLALSDGSVVASHTSAERAPEEGSALPDLRLVTLAFDAASARYRAGAPLTAGIRKTLRWWSAAGPARHSGPLWELEAVEVLARARPVRPAAPLDAPERAVLAEEHVSLAALRDWMRARGLALIVTRDQTSRDRADLQQPYNLRVPGGVSTIARAAPAARVYDIAQFQIFAAEQLRAYPGRPGRRVLARPLGGARSGAGHETAAGAPNPASAGVPPGSVKIAADGSTAAFVPARRALTWQSLDPAGVPIVRERSWITLQPGEIRTCPSCHGLNSVDQAGRGVPANKPQALRELLSYWKTLPIQRGRDGAK